jgi:hypothetical protein
VGEAVRAPVRRGDGAVHDEVNRNPPWCPVVSEAEKGFGAAAAGCGGGTPVTSGGGEWFLKLRGQCRGERNSTMRMTTAEGVSSPKRGRSDGSGVPVARRGHEDGG